MAHHYNNMQPASNEALMTAGSVMYTSTIGSGQQRMPVVDPSLPLSSSLPGPYTTLTSVPSSPSPSVAVTVAAASTGGAIRKERKRSSSSKSFNAVEYAQRRATHNAIERARRESLNSQFQDLASAVPSLIQVRRPSKANIVEKSLEYIKSFKEHMNTRDQCIKELQMRNMALCEEINRLRKQMGAEPVIPNYMEPPSMMMAAPASSPLSKEIVPESSNNENVSDDNNNNNRGEKKPSATKESSPSSTIAGNSRDSMSFSTQHSQQQQSKRRQHSLDLRGVSSYESEPFEIRDVGNAKPAATPLHINTSGKLAIPMQQQRLSPLSAPILNNASQLPMVVSQQQQLVSSYHGMYPVSMVNAGNVMNMNQIPQQQQQQPSAGEVAAATAFVAHANASHHHYPQQQQQQHAAALNALSLSSAGSSMTSHNIPLDMQANSMGFFTYQQQQQHQHSGGGDGNSSLNVVDLSKLSDMFTTVTSSSQAALLSPADEISAGLRLSEKHSSSVANPSGAPPASTSSQ